MNINKARGLGFFYTFIVVISILILPCWLAGQIGMGEYIFEKKEVVIDGEIRLKPDLSTIKPGGWQIIIEGGRHYFEILTLVTFIFSIRTGVKFGEKVLIKKQAKPFFGDNSLKWLLGLCFFISTSIWHFSFIMIGQENPPSSDFFVIYNFIMLCSAFIIGFSLSNNFLEPLLRKLLNRNIG